MVVVSGKGIGSLTDQSGYSELKTTGFGTVTNYESALVASDDNRDKKGEMAELGPRQPTSLVSNGSSLPIVVKDNVKNPANSMALTLSPTPDTSTLNSMALVVKPSADNTVELKEIDLPADGVHKVWGMRSRFTS